MNYLAHIFLARETGEAMVGALLGDFVKGENRERYSPTIEREIAIHRKIDTFTDSHPVVSLAKREIGERKRRYAGILLDVFYDQVLARTWSSYSGMPLSCFTQGFYAALASYEQVIPDNLRAIMPTMIQEDWLASYEDFSGVEAAICRISERLTKNGHLLRDGLLDLRANYGPIAAGFEVFFSELIRHVADLRGCLDETWSPGTE